MERHRGPFGRCWAMVVHVWFEALSLPKPFRCRTRAIRWYFLRTAGDYVVMLCCVMLCYALFRVARCAPSMLCGSLMPMQPVMFICRPSAGLSSCIPWLALLPGNAQVVVCLSVDRKAPNINAGPVLELTRVCIYRYISHNARW